MTPPALRVTPDDPDYIRQAAAESAYWQGIPAGSLEALEGTYAPGPVDRYMNCRFTGTEDVRWVDRVHRHGPFARGAMLGTGSPLVEDRILRTNPSLHLTLFDLAAGPLARRQRWLGERYPGRVTTRVADLNFLELEEGGFDLIVSLGTVHHVTNLEYLAHQINRGLAPGGLFFLEDYVGEPRFQFSAEKKRVYEVVFNRDRQRHGTGPSGVVWFDASDLSPFCGVRSDEILPVFRQHLDEIEVHTACALVTPLLRSRPERDSPSSPWATDSWMAGSRLRYLFALLRHRFPALLGKPKPMQALLDPAFLDDLFLVGDVLAEAGLLVPGQAYAAYRKRTEEAATTVTTF